MSIPSRGGRLGEQQQPAEELEALRALGGDDQGAEQEGTGVESQDPCRYPVHAEVVRGADGGDPVELLLEGHGQRATAHRSGRHAVDDHPHQDRLGHGDQHRPALDQGDLAAGNGLENEGAHRRQQQDRRQPRVAAGHFAVPANSIAAMVKRTTNATM
jgi:hypothetical protein